MFSKSFLGAPGKALVRPSIWKMYCCAMGRPRSLSLNVGKSRADSRRRARAQRRRGKEAVPHLLSPPRSGRGEESLRTLGQHLVAALQDQLAADVFALGGGEHRV